MKMALRRKLTIRSRRVLESDLTTQGHEPTPNSIPNGEVRYKQEPEIELEGPAKVTIG
jgi:hypothetical protein